MYRGGRKTIRLADRPVIENEKLQILKLLDEFQKSEEEFLTFPASYSNHQRAAVHELCKKYGFNSQSEGTGNRRQVTVFKTSTDWGADDDVEVEQVYALDLDSKSQAALMSHFQKFPVQESELDTVVSNNDKFSKIFRQNPKNCKQIAQNSDPESFLPDEKRMVRFPRNAALRKSKKQIVSERNQLESRRKSRQMVDIMKAKQNLPIWEHRDKIIELINMNRVVLIAGNTGCGKTTQVPQFIYEQGLQQEKAVRVLCSQPRRLSAITVANRVAQELGEDVGNTAGYQIRLEREGGHHSSIMFCTNGVLLRMLTESDPNDVLQNVTHVIIDEIHERDLHADFLLLVMKDILQINPEIKLILMSATMQTDTFSKYFNNCPIYEVPGAMYEVEEYYLDQVLVELGYTKSLPATNGSKKFQQQNSNNKKNKRKQISREKRGEIERAMEEFARNDSDECAEELIQCLEFDQDEERNQQGVYGFFNPLLIDYQHRQTKMTALMLLACKGKMDQVKLLLSEGADPTVVLDNGMDVAQLSRKFGQLEVAQVVEQAIAEQIRVEKLVESDEALLAYQSGRDENEIDVDLIEYLLCKICETPLRNDQVGAVLVFLPGWDEIMKVKERVEQESSELRKICNNRISVLPLHSKVAASEQKKVFIRPPAGVRKIVLATNIAETAVTINDVVFVINSGKLKEKSYDPYKAVSILQTQWISQASEQQRRGRAGRCQPGKCYHLYSRLRSSHLMKFQEPEIKRSALDELCLQVRLILQSGYQGGQVTVKQFLSKAIEPPIERAIDDAIRLLRDIGAMETNSEMLTTLGKHLALLPISPRLGKMLLYGVMYSCLDPMLTVACSISYRDPWMLPLNPGERVQAEAAKAKLQEDVGGSSDHLLLVRAFNEWSSSDNPGYYCKRMFLSGGTMMMIDGMRKQLLQEMMTRGLVRDLKAASKQADNGVLVRCVLACGIYPQIGLFYGQGQRGSKNMVYTKDGENARVHMLSTNKKLIIPKIKRSQAQKFCPLAAFDEITRGDNLMYVRQNTLVSPLPIILVASSFTIRGNCNMPVEEDVWDVDEDLDGNDPEYVELNTSYQDDDGGIQKQTQMVNFKKNTKVVVDGWLPFLVPFQCLAELAVLRLRLQSVFFKLIERKSDFLSPQEQSAVACAMKLFQQLGGDSEIDLGHVNSGKSVSTNRGNMYRQNNTLANYVPSTQRQGQAPRQGQVQWQGQGYGQGQGRGQGQVQGNNNQFSYGFISKKKYDGQVKSLYNNGTGNGIHFGKFSEGQMTTNQGNGYNSGLAQGKFSQGQGQGQGQMQGQFSSNSSNNSYQSSRRGSGQDQGYGRGQGFFTGKFPGSPSGAKKGGPAQRSGSNNANRGRQPNQRRIRLDLQGSENSQQDRTNAGNFEAAKNHARGRGGSSNNKRTRGQ